MNITKKLPATVVATLGVTAPSQKGKAVVRDERHAGNGNPPLAVHPGGKGWMCMNDEFVKRKAHLDADGKARVHCPNCHQMKVAHMAKYRAVRALVKVRCNCGYTFHLIVDGTEHALEHNAVASIQACRNKQT